MAVEVTNGCVDLFGSKLVSVSVLLLFIIVMFSGMMSAIPALDADSSEDQTVGFLGLPPPTVQEWIVDLNGSGDFTDIQSAIDAADDGDTIFVYDGLYNNTVNINKTINLIGNGTSSTFISISEWAPTINVEANDVNVSGFNLNGIFGVSVGDYDNTQLRNIIVNNSFFGIMSDSSSNLDISNITVLESFIGIYMDLSSNVTITQSNVSNSIYGIAVIESSNVHAINNSVNDSYLGIATIEADNFNLSGNTIDNCTIGIMLEVSEFGVITDNVISKAEKGIYLTGSQNMTLTDNLMLECGIVFEGDQVSFWNTHVIDETNLIDGKPALYLKNQNGMIVDGSYGQIIMANCSDMELRNQSIDNVSIGIVLGFCNEVLMTNSSISRTGHGVIISHSQNITIGDNLFIDIYEFGISVYNASIVIVIDNTLSSNINGISIDYGSNINVSRNTIDDCYYGITIFQSESGLIDNNTITNADFGIGLHYSHNMTLTDNLMLECGIVLEGDELSFWNTHVIDESNLVNGKPALYLKDQNDMIVDGIYGQVIMVNCSDMELRNQSIGNTSAGITMGFSECIFVTNSVILGCMDGANIQYSQNISISNSNLSDNNEKGIFLFESNYNDFWNLTVMNNYIGIYFSNSFDNSVQLSNFSNNLLVGIVIDGSDNNVISGSNFSDNLESGLVLTWSSYYNIINDNLFYSNDVYGILIQYYSEENQIFGNNISNNGCGLNILDSENNIIYHNNFINNDNQSFDNSGNYWNLTYPGGGNYWNDHIGVDHFNGPEQNQWPSDGYIDSRYDIIGNVSSDMYPLLGPWFLDQETPNAVAGENLTTDKGDVVNFNSTGSTDNVGIVNYSWSFNDGFTDVVLYGAAPSHEFMNVGIFIVTLNVTDASGNWNVDEVTITVNHVVNIGPITDEKGNLLIGVLVTINYNGEIYTNYTDENGLVSFSITPAEGVSQAQVSITMNKFVSTSYTLDLNEETDIDSVELELDILPSLTIMVLVFGFILTLFVMKMVSKP